MGDKETKEQEEQVEQTETTEVEPVNPEVPVPEQGLTTGDVAERRAGEGEEPHDAPPELTPQK